VSRFARPYAQAFLETVPAGYDVEGFLAAAGAIQRAIVQDPRLKHFLTAPSIPLDAKRRVLEELAAQAGVDEFGRRFLGLVLEKRRIAALPEILSTIRAVHDRISGIVEAQVTVAAPLDPAESARIEEALARKLNRRVRMKVDVDPKILAGFVAKVGSEVYDASALRAIERFHEMVE